MHPYAKSSSFFTSRAEHPSVCSRQIWVRPMDVSRQIWLPRERIKGCHHPYSWLAAATRGDSCSEVDIYLFRARLSGTQIGNGISFTCTQFSERWLAPVHRGLWHTEHQSTSLWTKDRIVCISQYYNTRLSRCNSVCVNDMHSVCADDLSA